MVESDGHSPLGWFQWRLLANESRCDMSIMHMPWMTDNRRMPPMCCFGSYMALFCGNNLGLKGLRASRRVWYPLCTLLSSLTRPTQLCFYAGDNTVLASVGCD